MRLRKKKIIVPRDVRQKARKPVYEGLVTLVIGLVIAYVIVDYIYDGLMIGNFGFGNLSTTVALIFFVPFWISGIPFRYIDSDWYGEIIKIDSTNNVPKRMEERTVVPTNVIALIKTETGKLYERNIYYEGDNFNGDRQRVYAVGDRVIHVCRTDYLFPLRYGNDDRPTVCVICGTKFPVGTKKCGYCNTSLEIRLGKERAK